MRKRIVTAGVAGSLCLLATLLFSADHSQNRPPALGETEQLRQRVRELEARVQALEGKVRQFEAKPGPPIIVPSPGPGQPPPRFRIVPPLPPGTIVRPPPGASSQPKIWGQGECNGWPFYVVPLNSDAGAGPASAAPAPPR